MSFLSRLSNALKHPETPLKNAPNSKGDFIGMLKHPEAALAQPLDQSNIFHPQMQFDDNGNFVHRTGTPQAPNYTNNYQNPMMNRVAPTPQMQMPMQQQPAFNPQQQAAMNTMRFGGNRPQQQYTPPQMMQPPIMPSQMPQNMNMAQNPNQMASPAMSGAPWNVQRRFT